MLTATVGDTLFRARLEVRWRGPADLAQPGESPRLWIEPCSRGRWAAGQGPENAVRQLKDQARDLGPGAVAEVGKGHLGYPVLLEDEGPTVVPISVASGWFSTMSSAPFVKPRPSELIGAAGFEPAKPPAPKAGALTRLSYAP